VCSALGSGVRAFTFTCWCWPNSSRLMWIQQNQPFNQSTKSFSPFNVLSIDYCLLCSVLPKQASASHFDCTYLRQLYIEFLSIFICLFIYLLDLRYPLSDPTQHFPFVFDMFIFLFVLLTSAFLCRTLFFLLVFWCQCLGDLWNGASRNIETVRLTSPWPQSVVISVWVC